MYANSSFRILLFSTTPSNLSSSSPPKSVVGKVSVEWNEIKVLIYVIEVDSYKNGRVLVTIRSWNGIGLWVSMFGA